MKVLVANWVMGMKDFQAFGIFIEVGQRSCLMVYWGKQGKKWKILPVSLWKFNMHSFVRGNHDLADIR